MSENNSGGGGCGWLILLLLIGGGGYMASTNPPESEHRRVIALKYRDLEKGIGVMNFFTWFSGGSVRLVYRNYILFSTITLEVIDRNGRTGTIPITSGMFGKVE